MKRLILKYTAAAFLFSLLVTYSCKKDFLEVPPLGLLSETTLASKAGVNGLLVGAYSLLDGHPGGNQMPQSMSNWHFGGVASDDAHKGSEYGDQTDLEFIENYSALPVNSYFNAKWISLYNGVQRSNDVLRTLALVKDGSISPAESVQIEAESKFLRGVFHFEAAKLWRNIPYCDENISFGKGNYNVPNTVPVWPLIEADLKFAADNLTPTKTDAGRANSWAAKAFLAKVYMFQQKFNEAKVLLDDIIANGVTAKGDKYGLLPNYADNFNPLKKNSLESVFAAQMSVYDGSNGQNGNSGELYSWNGGPTLCCGFYVPSFSLVNSYKVDANGLPLLDTWNNYDLKNDMNIATDEPFTPTTDAVDPRLDFTCGRRGLPYNDWGLMPGASWLVAQAAQGPYNNKKNVPWQKDKATTYENRRSSINYNMIRFADVLLWAAEVEVEIGSLAKAEEYVNMVRTRAANPTYWIKTYVNPSTPMAGFTSTNAANYQISTYPVGTFAANGKDFSRKAVRFERKIELAMEGHRFFDLQRYDNGSGYMADVLNAYIAHENKSFSDNSTDPVEYLILKGAVFTKGQDELYPIPQSQIDLSMSDGKPTLVQNPGY
jgi:hypothetical protein